MSDATLNHPWQQFTDWCADVEHLGEPQKNVMALATVGSDGSPHVRMVLFKGVIDEKISFYTNYESLKAEDLSFQSRVACVFHWPSLKRQLRIQGAAEKMVPELSEKYFQSRPRDSQVSAWASPQSKVVSGLEELESRVADIEKRFQGQPLLPCPPFWGGYLIAPHSFEFWEERPGRLHSRMRYRRTSSEAWKLEILGP